jgi:hypothetical protein
MTKTGGGTVTLASNTAAPPLHAPTKNAVDRPKMRKITTRRDSSPKDLLFQHRLKHAPPMQVKLRSEGQAGGLSLLCSMLFSGADDVMGAAAADL